MVTVPVTGVAVIVVVVVLLDPPPHALSSSREPTAAVPIVHCRERLRVRNISPSRRAVLAAIIHKGVGGAGKLRYHGVRRVALLLARVTVPVLPTDTLVGTVHLISLSTLDTEQLSVTVPLKSPTAAAVSFAVSEELAPTVTVVGFTESEKLGAHSLIRLEASIDPRPVARS